MVLSHLIFNSLKTKNPSHPGTKIFLFLNINNSMQKKNYKTKMWRFISTYTLLHIYIFNFIKIIQKKWQKFIKSQHHSLFRWKTINTWTAMLILYFPLCLLLQGFVYLLAAIIWHESYLEMYHHKRHKMCCQEY